MKQLALIVRREWMTLFGLSPQEIEFHCQPDAIIFLEEELQELEALKCIQQINNKHKS